MVAGLLALSMLLPFTTAAPTTGFTSPSPGAPAESWAWGATFAKTDQGTFSGTTQSGVPWSLSFSIHGFLSWNTVLTQTNTSTTSFELEAQRVILGAYFLSATGTQGPTTGSVNITVLAWEQDHSFSNFTTTGTVLLNGTTSVPAVAIESVHALVNSNLTARVNASLTGGQTGAMQGYASGAVHADATLNFAPALGLVPVTPVPDSWWNSTSTYTAQGTYADACHFQFSATNPMGASTSGTGTCGGSGSLDATNTVWLRGTDAGDDYLAGFGHYRSTLLELGGNLDFNIHDGLIFVPGHLDVFGGTGLGGTSPASPQGTEVITGHVDLDPHASHFGMIASSSQFSPQATATGALPSGLAATYDGTQATASSSPAVSGLPSYNVQGKPESAQSALTANGCLLNPTGSQCKTSAPAHTFLLLLVVVAAVAVVVAVLVARRERGPKGGVASRPGVYIPSRSDAGAGSRSGVAAPTPPGTPPGSQRPTPSQDPLSNLW
ncbi:MAG: hypothetical protein KGJ23_07330 [Euryarchaeota archaeon]|nr:hypothetical protein [Euryarchaeota archaeon]MDE1836412.1 hypothetical protein [Euryarchaeota archaeon]MDE1879073.1 hypothetical protein [Euryarchaeota archaeon]MDE2044160.1 hypothetical protein [Thermoplasmata archaeon]